MSRHMEMVKQLCETDSNLRGIRVTLVELNLNEAIVVKLKMPW